MCKECEIFRRMPDMYRDAWFLSKNFIIGPNISFLQWGRIKKTIYGMETHWLSGKEKVLSVAVSKESHADSLVGQERTHHYWFGLVWFGFMAYQPLLVI